MDVTIIGGGVCGLALAHQLAPDHDVTVLEASPGPRGGGYMIDFFGPGVEAAQRMGVLEELRSRGTLFDGVRWERPDRRTTGRIDVASLIGDSFGGYFSILRPEVELGLLAQLPSSVDLRYGAQVVAVRDADLRGAGSPQSAGSSRSAQVELADGTTRTADLVVACDGVRSRAREHVAPGSGPVIPMGYRAASYLFEDPELAAELGDWAMLTDTLGRTGGLYAAGPTQAAVLLAGEVDRSITARPTADPRALQANYAGLHPLIDRALTHAPATYYDDLVAQSVAPRWSRGRVALAGDAAGAVSLLAGMGTSLAIAGAETLARSLRAAGPHVEIGLADYERRWRPVVERGQRMGRRSAVGFLPVTRRQQLVRRLALRGLGVPGAARRLGRRLTER